MRRLVHPTWRKLIARSLAAVLLSSPFWLTISSEGSVSYKLHISGITLDDETTFSFSNTIVSPLFSGTNQPEFLVTKTIDKSSPVIAQRLCDGQMLDSVRMEFRETSGTFTRYYSISLEDVLVSSMDTSGAVGTNIPTESISMNYAKIVWTYIQTDPPGTPGQGSSSYWDQQNGTSGNADPDSDGDGIPDSYEFLHDLLSLAVDGGDDADDDGLTNLDEYRAGTSASDSNSVLRVSGVSIPLPVGTLVDISFQSVPGRIYDLYAASEVGGSYTFVQSVTATGTTTTETLTLPGSQVFVLVKVRAY